MDGGELLEAGIGKPAEPIADLGEIRRRNLSAQIVAARLARSDRTQELLFAFRHFLGGGLPAKRPPRAKLVFETRDGAAKLAIHASADHGLPFGQDRLLLIWLASAFFAAGSPADNRIRFAAAGNILEAFEQPPKGRQMLLLRERILRVFHAAFVFSHGTRRLLDVERSQLIRAVRMSFWAGQRGRAAWSQWSQRIDLDPTFAATLRKGGAVPIDLQTVRALKTHPIALDLYQWQVFRSWALAKSGRDAAAVPLFGADGLCAQFGLVHSRERKSREILTHAQARIRMLWPDCPNDLDRSGEAFCVKPDAAIKPARGYVRLPGVRPAPQWVLDKEAREAEDLEGKEPASSGEVLSLDRLPA
jgi:hypothetical protein